MTLIHAVSRLDYSREPCSKCFGRLCGDRATIVPRGRKRVLRLSLFHTVLQKMIKFFVWILFRENLSFDLGKKFGREQADSLISRPNYGLNIQEPFSAFSAYWDSFGYEKGQNSLSSYGSPSRERFLNGPNINAPKLKAEEIFSISTRVSGALRVTGNATVEAVPSDKRLGTYRFGIKLLPKI